MTATATAARPMDLRASLTGLADRIDTELNDETADRQKLAESAAAGLRELAATLGAARVADLVEILGALAHAEQHLRERAAAPCRDCTVSPSGACQQHLDDLGQADAYQAIAARLTGQPEAVGAGAEVTR